MALSRSFKETVKARAERDAARHYVELREGCHVEFDHQIRAAIGRMDRGDFRKAPRAGLTRSAARPSISICATALRLQGSPRPFSRL